MRRPTELVIPVEQNAINGWVLFPKVGNRRTDGRLSAGGTVHRGHLEQPVGIDFEGSNEFGLTTRHRRDASELELSKKPVIPALRPFALVDREGDSGLVILDGGKRSTLIGRDGSIAGHYNAKDVALHCDT